ncbi:beta-glucan synthesis-associated [Vararia minispora EC-137]|uniref:Beta-glucan synthesis-associated n=1 Tax=Vararia minispora EC-137 TaxID=1314806 RepID=A0ACB8QQ87_9AGAM|nr:beta-glucan synthesis-associated [Vararia minispora EC-137]
MSHYPHPPPTPTASSPLLPGHGFPSGRDSSVSHSSEGSDERWSEYDRGPDSLPQAPERPFALNVPERSASPAPSLAGKDAFAHDPVHFPLISDPPDADDALHTPDPDNKRGEHDSGTIFTLRGLTNIGFLLVLAAGLMTLLYASFFLLHFLFPGFPIYSFYSRRRPSTQGGFGLGATNATGQVPLLSIVPPLIDAATPQSALTKASSPGDQWQLVFSDEFEVDGRTFWPGDDPYWEAVDLHYWGTNDLEWYDPKQAYTKGGYLHLTLDNADPINNHNMSYISGMTRRNKFCFTGGLIEVAVQLPGTNTKPGLWPAVWTMGNLGRAGFGASLDGMWPYTYDACDVGTLPNQTYPGTQTPLAATQNGDPQANGELSWLPGQRLSACTCPSEDHPGPQRSDGSYVGRAAPEIDIFEALANAGFGQVSQSAQWAPFNAEYKWQNTSANPIIPNPGVTSLNGYIGGSTQQTTSGLSTTDQDCYELEKGCFSVYGFEYDNSYITWIVNDTAVWTLEGVGMGADNQTEISARPVPQEPMYIIMNLGFSKNFAHNLDPSTLTFPTSMLVDWVRVYQPAGKTNYGCDPADFPTTAYIDRHMEAYTNANLTNWAAGPNKAYYGASQPKNKLVDTTCS